MSSIEQQGFSLEVQHNPHLAEGAGILDARIGVTGTSTAVVSLRLRTPVGAAVVFVKQVAPVAEDLTHRRVDTDDRTGEYPLGPWNGDHRDYHLRVEVEPAAPGREKLVARVSLVADGTTAAEGLVKARWTAGPVGDADAPSGTVLLRGTPAAGEQTASDGHPTHTARLRKDDAPKRAVWTAVVAADREFYDRVLARGGPDTVEFPKLFPERRIVLRRNATVIGRRNLKQGVEPDIDLGIHPMDRGVSTRHAVLQVRDAGLTVTDLGSTNGTSLNGSDELLPNGAEVTLADGDRIHVGAWTTITVERTE
jgi:FHA domain